MNHEKSAILQWAENNEKIFKERGEMRVVFEEMMNTPVWNVWKYYKLERQYNKHLDNLLFMQLENNSMLRASLL